ncbi:lantibiotic protection ABC transporter ATP-binding protein [Pseudobutyrivibrio sp. 49]|uniref:lantibiotic protection ABC transporter ATP-binding protein n=1 Tax=Pseudobutyrivibrio sp. 49 TaxID=1855344 RepID=UPI002E8E2793|nr:lantibiotic protection ABC transporter ATP-binding protein [Pseudobutyrivibrio sp. 49]
MQMILRTENLTKKYFGFTAVENVNLEIPEGKIYGLLGPNGAGKSTILKMITGIAKPTSGTIYYDEKPWTRKALADIGALIEMPPIYPNLTAYENMLVKAKLLGVPKERIQEKLEITGIAKTGNKKAGDFSLGMKQRLGIALALLNDPKLLILDEPTNGLDPYGIEELRELLRSFSKQGISIIMSSHILSEVQMIADAVGIISEGHVVYQGMITPEDDLNAIFMEYTKNRRLVG